MVSENLADLAPPNEGADETAPAPRVCVPDVSRIKPRGLLWNNGGRPISSDRAWKPLEREHFVEPLRMANTLLVSELLTFEVSMRLFTLRLLAITALVTLYTLNSMLGVAALVCSFGYIVVTRRSRLTSSGNSDH